MCIKAEKALTLWLTDNTKVTYLLSGNPMITFSGGELVVSTEETAAVTFDRSQVSKYTFEDIQPATVISVEVSTQPVTVTVSNLSGTCLYSATAPAGEGITMTKDMLPTGIYIITVNGKSQQYQIKK